MTLGTGLTVRELVFRYVSFAVIATIANLAVQRLVLAGGAGAARFAVAVGAGTLVGLVVKYVLDKNWIFADTSDGLRDHGRKFTLYTVAGVFTTMIFWGFESVFWFVWKSTTMREVGAVLGLACGYIIKFLLDRRFVFTDARLEIERAR